jgi:YgiT-type zinc finger domain-containing protein
MKEKIWKDCPSCGSKDSMKFKKNLKKKFNYLQYGSILIEKLDGYECSNCKDVIFTKKSQSLINSKVAELKAKVDSDRIVASQLASVDEVAKKFKVSRQAVHKMMNTGRIRYVFVGDIRLPLKDQNLIPK